MRPRIEDAELRAIDKQELADLLLNKGVLQEVNRTFFNPLGLDLILTEELKLKLMASENPYGVVKHTIDINQVKIFNEFRTPKLQKRQATIGFIIQISDIIRKALIQDNTLTPTSTLKLNYLLQCVDNVTYEVKKRLMQKSGDYDSHLEDMNERKVFQGMEVDVARENYIDAVAKLILLQFKDGIKEKLVELRKIATKQMKIKK